MIGTGTLVWKWGIKDEDLSFYFMSGERVDDSVVTVVTVMTNFLYYFKPNLPKDTGGVDQCFHMLSWRTNSLFYRV